MTSIRWHHIVGPIKLRMIREANWDTDLAGAVAGLARGAASLPGRGEVPADGPDDLPLLAPDPTSAAVFLRACRHRHVVRHVTTLSYCFAQLHE